MDATTIRVDADSDGIEGLPLDALGGETLVASPHRPAGGRATERPSAGDVHRALRKVAARAPHVVAVVRAGTRKGLQTAPRRVHATVGVHGDHGGPRRVHEADSPTRLAAMATPSDLGHVAVRRRATVVLTGAGLARQVTTKVAVVAAGVATRPYRVLLVPSRQVVQVATREKGRAVPVVVGLRAEAPHVPVRPSPATVPFRPHVVDAVAARLGRVAQETALPDGT